MPFKFLYQVAFEIPQPCCFVSRSRSDVFAVGTKTDTQYPSLMSFKFLYQLTCDIPQPCCFVIGCRSYVFPVGTKTDTYYPILMSFKQILFSDIVENLVEGNLGSRYRVISKGTNILDCSFELFPSFHG